MLGEYQGRFDEGSISRGWNVKENDRTDIFLLFSIVWKKNIYVTW